MPNFRYTQTDTKLILQFNLFQQEMEQNISCVGF